MGVISIEIRKTSATKSFEDSIIKKGAKEFLIWRRHVEDRCGQPMDEKCGN